MVLLKQIASSVLLCLLAVLVGTTGVAVAAQSSSPHYQVNQVFFGSGGELNACSTGSTGYCSKQSAGELGVGKTCSGNQYCAQAGFNTDRTPYLQFEVNASSIDLGKLDASSTATATAKFSVKTYLASGYSVVNASPPPQNGGYTMKTPSTPTASNAGTEQFGINLVDNPSCTGLPTDLGAGPKQVPDSTFSFGTATSNYSTPCKFMYADTAPDNVIAKSDESSGETDYTISYIFNISNVTPGGTFTMDHVLVATSTY